MFERILPHDLFEGKGVDAGVCEPGLLLNLDAVLINIIHAAAQPSLLIGCQLEIVTFAPGGAVPGLPDRAPDPDVVVIISIRMPKHEVDIVSIGRIAIPDIKTDSGPEAAVPLLA